MASCIAGTLHLCHSSTRADKRALDQQQMMETENVHVFISSATDRLLNTRVSERVWVARYQIFETIDGANQIVSRSLEYILDTQNDPNTIPMTQNVRTIEQEKNLKEFNAIRYSYRANFVCTKCSNKSKNIFFSDFRLKLDVGCCVPDAWLGNW